MPTKTIARCSIYETRPQRCVEYPVVGDWIPSQCGFYFDSDGKRMGSCDCEEGVCCAIPRTDGEPTGAALPAEVGGKPCKYLEWRDVDYEDEDGAEKVAALCPNFFPVANDD